MTFLQTVALGCITQLLIWGNAYYISYYIAKGWRKGGRR